MHVCLHTIHTHILKIWCSGLSSWGPICILKAKFLISHLAFEPILKTTQMCQDVPILVKLSGREQKVKAGLWVTHGNIRSFSSDAAPHIFTSFLVHCGQSPLGLRNGARVHLNKVVTQLGHQKKDRICPVKTGGRGRARYRRHWVAHGRWWFREAETHIG